MVKKYCPKCESFSFSAYEKGKWVCPICGRNLTEEKVLPLEESDLNGKNID